MLQITRLLCIVQFLSNGKKVEVAFAHSDSFAENHVE